MTNRVKKSQSDFMPWIRTLIRFAHSASGHPTIPKNDSRIPLGTSKTGPNSGEAPFDRRERERRGPAPAKPSSIGGNGRDGDQPRRSPLRVERTGETGTSPGEALFEWRERERRGPAPAKPSSIGGNGRDGGPDLAKPSSIGGNGRDGGPDLARPPSIGRNERSE